MVKNLQYWLINPYTFNRRKNYAKIFDHAKPFAAFSKILCGKNKTFCTALHYLDKYSHIEGPCHRIATPFHGTESSNETTIFIIRKWSVLAAVQNWRIFWQRV